MAPGPRRLAAIMFTDMVSYSALAHTDERSALRLLETHNALLRPVFARFRGREIKTVGDAFLVEFESALDAVECAVEIQRSIREFHASPQGDPRLQVRIGLHVGDVVRSGNDVLGDAVNIASRIAGIADPGTVCVSQQVLDQVQNKVPERFVRLPPATLKNIGSGVAVFSVVPATSPEGGSPRPGAPGPARHLAVLPLANISPDAKDEYFADGLTEELISTLSQVRDLSVIARTSVLSYKTAPKSIAQVGAELGVDSVLEGSVRRAGNRLRITLQLIDVATQGHVWATSYNREIDDIFAIQADIAERTAEALRLKLSSGAAGAADRRPTANPAAYDLYLQGLVTGRSPGGLGTAEAVRCFEAATRLDPTFAEAYAAWADLYVTCAGDSLSMADVMPRARELAARALALDPESSEAHSALANIAFQADQDWAGAERGFRRAIELNRSNVTAHRFYALLLMALDRIDEAREELRRVIRLDPGGSAGFTFALAEMLDGEFDAAIDFARRECDANPSAVSGHVYLGLFLVGAGRREEAKAEADFPAQGATEDVRFDHALLNALVGRPAAGREILAETEAGRAKSYTSDTHRAILYAALGEGDRAIDLLEADYRRGERVLWLFHRGVWFDGIRSDPRFVALEKQYGLPTDRVRGPPRRPAAA